MRWNRLYQFAKTAFKVYQCDCTCPSSNSLNPSKTQHCVKIMGRRKTTTALIMDAVMSLNIDFPKNLGSIWVTREGIYVRLIHSDVFPSLKLSLVQGASIHYNKNEILRKVGPCGGGVTSIHFYLFEGQDISMDLCLSNLPQKFIVLSFLIVSYFEEGCIFFIDVT